MESNWQDKAGSYYRDGLKISEISLLLDVSRQSISKFLKTLPDQEQIRQQRKAESLKNRRKYKTKKQKMYRAAASILAVTPESMRREHELAAIELSRERYH